MPTKVAYRRAIAELLGGYSLTNNFLTTGDATKLNLTVQGKSTELTTTWLSYVWAFVPSLVATIPQARIKKTGLTIATGIVDLEDTLGAVVATGAEVELHSKLPAVAETHSGLSGSVTEAVDWAIRNLLITDSSATITLASGICDYSLAGHVAFLDRAERLLDVRVGDPNALTTGSTAHRWTVYENASGLVLHFEEPFAFLSGPHLAYLVTRRPADSIIAVAGTWGASTAGLVNETDQARSSLNEVTTGALAYCYRQLAARSHGEERATYEALYQVQMAEFASLPNYINRSAMPAPEQQAEAA